MSILYVSAFPQKYFDEILLKKNISSSLCAQKFNKLIVDGLHENQINVTVLITLNPYAYSTHKIYYKPFKIIENGVNYYFVPHLKIRFLGSIVTSVYIKRFCNNFLRHNDNSILLFDVLKPYIYPIVKVFRKSSNKIVAIFTDLPQYFDTHKKGLISKIKSNNNLYVYDSISKYIILTKYFNEIINKNKYPSLIIEGLADNCESNTDYFKDKKNIIMYTGDLNKLYGIKNLIDAFIGLKNNDYELHLYGQCDYKDELNEICSKNSNIKYFGIISNHEIIKRQKEAMLLINPRPINLEFNKYSFPSKIVEYMVSGTPVLTTKLAGIPEQYDDYLYYIIDDSTEGIRRKIEEVINLDRTTLLKKGEMAREFVLKEKNNIRQTQKIIDFINNKEE